jgi:hypothetical protein
VYCGRPLVVSIVNSASVDLCPREESTGTEGSYSNKNVGNRHTVPHRRESLGRIL